MKKGTPFHIIYSKSNIDFEFPIRRKKIVFPLTRFVPTLQSCEPNNQLNVCTTSVTGVRLCA